MVLIRAAFTKIFPDLDRILTIDVDTLVRDIFLVYGI
jgi:lipopolysaccharide biosynthesis glycosyltransferase